jgi:hypothetical protein
MVAEFFHRLLRIRVTVAYAVIVTGVATALLYLGPRVQDRVIRHASTNLHNLSHGRAGTLFVSAFVVDAGPIYLWLPGLVCLMALAEVLWGSSRLVIAFAIGHVGATLLVAVGLTAAVERAWLPASVTRAIDVGMSYGAAAVLGSLTAAIPRRFRPAWLGWWLAAGIATVVLGCDFTDVGHAAALALGMGVSTQFGDPARWTRSAFVLLGAGAAFGFLLLAGTGSAAYVAAASGLAGAAGSEMLASWRVRRSKRDRSGQQLRPGVCQGEGDCASARTV